MKLFRIILSVSALVATACEPSSVEETGYLIAPEIDYTSDGPLTVSGENDLILVGRDGAITLPGGELTVSNTRSGADVSTTVVTDSGSFVLSIPARLGDTLELRYQVEGEFDTAEIALSDDLSGLAAPGCLNCVGLVISAPNASGNATVSLSELELADGRVVIFNQAKQASTSAPATTASLDVEADAGDTVCAYEVDAQGQQSPTSCALVPAS